MYEWWTKFSGITVNNGEKNIFWIGFRGLILADRTFILQLDAVAVEIDQHDDYFNNKLHQLIRENKITSEMATSLMKDTAYAYDIANSRVQMGLILFIGERNLDYMML